MTVQTVPSFKTTRFPGVGSPNPPILSTTGGIISTFCKISFLFYINFDEICNNLVNVDAVLLIYCQLITYRNIAVIFRFNLESSSELEIELSDCYETFSSSSLGLLESISSLISASTTFSSIVALISSTPSPNFFIARLVTDCSP